MTITIPPITSIPSKTEARKDIPLKHHKPKAKIAIKELRKQRPLSAELALESLSLLLLLDLQQQRAIDVWEDTTKGDGRTDEGV